MPLVGFNPCIILKIKLRIQLGIIARLKEPSNISVTFKSMADARQPYNFISLIWIRKIWLSYKHRTRSLFLNKEGSRHTHPRQRCSRSEGGCLIAWHHPVSPSLEPYITDTNRDIVLHAWNTTKKTQFLKVHICNINFNRYYSGSDDTSRFTTDVDAHINIYVTDVTCWQIVRGSRWKQILLLKPQKQPVHKQNMTYCHITTKF